MLGPVVVRWKAIVVIMTVVAVFVIGLMWAVPKKAFSSQEQEPFIADQVFVFHPNLYEFDIEAYLREKDSGLLSYYEIYDGATWSAVDAIEFTAHYYSLNPQVLLTLLEIETGAVTAKNLDRDSVDYAFGVREAGLSNQLTAAAEHLVQIYYGEKSTLHSEGSTVPMGVNPSTEALLSYFDEISARAGDRDRHLTRVEGSFYQVFNTLFYDPLSGNLVNASPDGPMRGARLPWLAGETWNYNGAPHNYYTGNPQCTNLTYCPLPWSSLDFGPPSIISCSSSDGGGKYASQWAAAVRDGEVVVANSNGIVVIDHQDGWLTHYVHLSQEGLIKKGPIKEGDPVGHPSCQGDTNGVHLHYAVKYDGDFQEIDKMNLGGWTVSKTSSHYDGYMDCPDGRHKTASSGRYETSKIADDCVPSTEEKLSVVLILDSTGSMGGNDPQRMRVDAAKAFIQASQIGDEIGVVDFASGARELAPMTIINSNSDKNRLIDAVDNVRSSGSTNINAGLNRGFTTLSQASGSAQYRTAILLTDGGHNVGPYDPNSHLQYADRNWPIYTVGFGQANQSLLYKISQETSGECVNGCRSLTDPSQLGQLYQDLRAKLTNSAPIINQQFRIQQGQQHSVPSSVPPNQFSTTFYIGWQGSRADLTLISPSGRIFDPTNLGPGVVHAKGATYELYQVAHPEPGLWAMSIYGRDIPAGGEEVNVYASTQGIRYSYQPFTAGAPPATATSTPLPPTLTPEAPTATPGSTATPFANRTWQQVGAGSASGGGISNNSGESGWPAVAMAADGKVYVAWYDKSGGDAEIYVKRWNGSSWQVLGGSASGGGISNNSGQSNAAAIAVAPNGTPYVAWRDWSSGVDQIYIRRWNGSSWQEVGSGSATGGGISGTASVSKGWPTIAIGADGRPLVAWEDSAYGWDQIYVKRWNGSQWVQVGNNSATVGGISKTAENSRRPHMTVGADGQPYVTWMDSISGNSEIFVRRFNGSIWQEVGSGSASGRGISVTGGDSQTPWVAIASDGTPYVAWTDNDAGDYEVYVRRLVGSTWQEVGPGSAYGGGISKNGGDSLKSRIVIAPDGIPYIVWHDLSAGDAEIYIRYWNGSSWVETGSGSASGGGISNNNGHSTVSGIAVSPSGVPYVAWGDSSAGDYEIYIKRWVE